MVLEYFKMKMQYFIFVLINKFNKKNKDKLDQKCWFMLCYHSFAEQFLCENLKEFNYDYKNYELFKHFVQYFKWKYNDDFHIT